MYMAYNLALAATTRPEVELLLSCARICMDNARAERIQVLVREPLDWDFLLQIASQHGMTPLLYWHLHATCLDAVPTAYQDALRNTFHVTAVYNVCCTRELLTLLRLFGEYGLP